MAIRTVSELRKRAAAGETLDFLFFWGHRPKHEDGVCKSCLSQWFPVGFELDGVSYASAEHYMMAEKARLFEDAEIRSRILAAATPAEAKALGRQVRGFDSALWQQCCCEVVMRGNLAKFEQNPALGDFLRSTGDAILVEASPVDCVWGIGWAEDDPQARLPDMWDGSNLLGFALMEVRERLR
ncbi:NADAR family protein [Chromobacterium haemolyticum]|uniref:NADAR family protein n=1 Tax=Chromobacterium fluminis TaxID=3044269 RepID=A0ABX0L797_9NEIS|nr:NADAR family protein [Chromobacterium haemolyticum]NHR04948.1 NADAR family protein [Chromobacterium haemolyticum]